MYNVNINFSGEITNREIAFIVLANACGKVLANKDAYPADIFISAIGKANYFNKKFFLDNRMLTEYLDNTIAVNLCINRDNEGKLCGDIDKELYNSFKDVINVPIIDLGF